MVKLANSLDDALISLGASRFKSIIELLYGSTQNFESILKSGATRAGTVVVGGNADAPGGNPTGTGAGAGVGANAAGAGVGTIPEVVAREANETGIRPLASAAQGVYARNFLPGVPEVAPFRLGGEIAVWVPSNEAFDELDLENLSNEDLKKLISNHAYVLPSGLLEDGIYLSTSLAGGPLCVAVQSGSITSVNGMRVDSSNTITIADKGIGITVNLIPQVITPDFTPIKPILKCA